MQYKSILETKKLDFIAVTDHNQTGFAKNMNIEFGEKIIIGEEITTSDGEIIGLFLKKTIPPYLTALQTAKTIREQNALVYIPHPFEKLRSGLKKDVLLKIIDYIDIIEVFNARARWRGEAEKSRKFAVEHNKSCASSSDSHCRLGLGSSYTIIDDIPSAKTLPDLLAKGTLQKNYAPFLSYLCPAVNKIKHSLIHGTT